MDFENWDALKYRVIERSVDNEEEYMADYWFGKSITYA